MEGESTHCSTRTAHGLQGSGEMHHDLDLWGSAHHRDPDQAKLGWCPRRIVGLQCTHPQAQIFGLGPWAFTVHSSCLNDILSMCFRECTQIKHEQAEPAVTRAEHH